MTNFGPGCIRFRKDRNLCLKRVSLLEYIKEALPLPEDRLGCREGDKVSKAFIIVLVLATVTITLTPAVADESAQGIQEMKVEHTAVQDEVNTNLNSQPNPEREGPLCQTVSLNGLRFDTRGCEKNPQWSITKW